MTGVTQAGAPAADPRAQRFAAFLELERAARAAETRAALGYLIVNDTGRLTPVRVAALVDLTGPTRLLAATGVSLVDRAAPFTLAVERIASRLDASGRSGRSAALTREDFSAEDVADWNALLPAHLAWTPLKDRGRVTGGVLYGRDAAFGAGDLLLLDQIADAFGHADAALAVRRRRPWRLKRRGRWIAAAAIAAALALALVPVNQTALAPAEIVAAEPALVAAPADGVLNGFEVSPGEVVAAGQVLFRLDDTAARAQRDVAERSLAVAEAELRRAIQGSFSDREANAQRDALRAQVDLKRAELAYARDLLERLAIRAPRAGTVVLADPRRFLGKPLRTGERVLEIADPARVEIRADVPVGQIIALKAGARTMLFLDIDPLHPVPARLVSASYEAEAMAGGMLAYRAVAALDEGAQPPRIGLRGTARIEGAPVSLGFYLFGRPLSGLRQFLGR